MTEKYVMILVGVTAIAIVSTIFRRVSVFAQQVLFPLHTPTNNWNSVTCLAFVTYSRVKCAVMQLLCVHQFFKHLLVVLEEEKEENEKF